MRVITDCGSTSICAERQHHKEEVWRQLRVITDWGRKVESPCQVQNCVANPEASRLAPFTAPMGSVWVTSPMEHFQQCQFVTRAWTQQIPLPMTSSGELGESKALVNEDVVAQSSIHCHSQISSINPNARAGLGCSEAPLSMRMLSNKVFNSFQTQSSSLSTFMMSGVNRRPWSTFNNGSQLTERLGQPVPSDKQYRKQSCQTFMS